MDSQPPKRPDPPGWRSLLRGALAIGREALRLILRRPVVGILAVPLDEDGRLVLMRRRDVGSWSLPGGMVEWGEPLVEALRRELREETGCALRSVRRIVGVYSDPARDPRMHSVTIVVEADVLRPTTPPQLNPMEVIAVESFSLQSIPSELAFDTRRLLDDYLRDAAAILD
jgi:ADP-ribose pyrophosphatase YjhB (NUDIX family)